MVYSSDNVDLKLLHMNNNNYEEKIHSIPTTDDTETIGEFYANKNIFVTGGTGFLGTVLLESLLSSSPNIGNIYVLVRAKYNSDAKSRINRLLSKPIFHTHTEKQLGKVKPVVGVLSETNFGINDDTYKMLQDNVNVIFHSAATIKFNSYLRTSIRTNVTGTLRTVEFAKGLRSLSAYVYLSTAFCNSNYHGYIKEQLYEPPEDPYEMMRMAENDSVWEKMSDFDLKDMIKGHPNTYTFTKQLAENMIYRELGGYPAGIVRPSVVYGTYEEPVKGWIGNASSGHLGFLVGYSKGIFRLINGNPESIIDVIPCDYVINSALVMGWYVGTRNITVPEIIHCSSGERNPLTLEKFRDYVNENGAKHPCDLIVWRPHATVRNGIRYTLCYYMFHLLPAIVLYWPERILQLGKPHHTIWEYMRIYHNGAKVFDYFLKMNFRYSLDNSIRIMSLLHKEDLKRYRYDSRDCDWSTLIERCLMGVRQFYYKESAKTNWWHRIMYKCYEVLDYIGWAALYVVFSFLFSTIGLGTAMSLTFGLIILSFLIWL